MIGATVPAWTGEPVYDDWLMRDSDAMGSLRDVALAFARTSADYFRQIEHNGVAGVTYRPLALASLILVQALGGTFLVHHAVSLALHLVGAGLLYAALRQRLQPGAALAIAAVWALHPMQVEAYGWVNGRSDVLAGAFVAGLARALFGPRRRAATAGALLCAAGALLAKETAMFAVGALMCARLVPSAGLPSRAALRREVRAIWAPACGVALALALRFVMVRGSPSGVAALAAEQEVGRRMARLLAEALVSLLVPVPRTMACLAWQLAQPLDVARVALLVVAAGGLAYLAVRLRLRALALLLGALVTLAPTLVVGSAFWCGLDRYLYMPTLLLALAAADLVPASPRALVRAGTARVLAGALCCLLTLATYATATNYRSQSAFMASLIQLRPEDPSGYLFGARWLGAAGQRAQALALLEQVPRVGLPRPLASALVTRLADLGRRDEAIGVLEDMVRRYPDDPYALYDLTWTSIQRGDLTRAFAAAERLRSWRGFCTGVDGLLASALKRPGLDHARVRAFRAQYACR